MKQADVEHLANLARIKLNEEEKQKLPEELSSIVDYVSVINDIASDDVDNKPTVGARFNVFRQDEITNEPDQYTKDILEEMPNTDGRFLSVKKILDTEE